MRSKQSFSPSERDICSIPMIDIKESYTVRTFQQIAVRFLTKERANPSSKEAL